MSQLSIKNWGTQLEKAILQGYESRKAFVHEINEYFRKKHEGHLKILEDFKQAQEQKKTISSEIYENDLVKKYRSGQKISTPSQWIWDTEITKWVNGKKSPTNSKTLIPILEFLFEKNIMSKIEANEWIMNLKFVMPDKELHKIIKYIGANTSSFTTNPWILDKNKIQEFMYIGTLFVVYGPVGCGKSNFIEHVANYLHHHFRSEISKGVFLISGKNTSVGDALFHIMSNVLECLPTNENEIFEIWEDWIATYIDKDIVVILDNVSPELVSYFIKYPTKIHLIVSTSDIENILPIISDSVAHNEVIFQTPTINKASLINYLSEYSRLHRDWVMNIAMLSEWYPEPIFRAIKLISGKNKIDWFGRLGDLPVKTTSVFNAHWNYPEYATRLHKVARAILASLREKERHYMLLFVLFAKSDEFYSIEVISKVWKLENALALFVIERLEKLGLLIRQIEENPIQGYVFNYRPLRFFIEAVQIANNFNQDPEIFLLSSEELF